MSSVTANRRTGRRRSLPVRTFCTTEQISGTMMSLAWHLYESVAEPEQQRHGRIPGVMLLQADRLGHIPITGIIPFATLSRRG